MRYMLAGDPTSEEPMNHPPVPEEFSARPDTYEHIPPAFLAAEYFRDGKLIQSTLREPVEERDEMQPGWTVQGGNRGQTA